MNIIYDIETRPHEKTYNAMLAEEPQFNADSVAIGNLKDEEKIKKKIIDAGIAHEKKMIEWRAKQKKTCCLDPDLGQLSAIGILTVETGTYEIIDATEDEAKALERWWEICDSTIRKGCLAFGWNTDNFDLPFLFGRSRLLGVEYDWTYITNYRFFHSGFVDLHKTWTFGQFGKFCKLDKACRALGFVEPDNEVNGATFHEYYERGGEDQKKAEAYLKNDLDMSFCVGKATHGLRVRDNVKDGDAFGDAH
jgi:hypothetical protein